MAVTCVLPNAWQLHRRSSFDQLKMYSWTIGLFHSLDCNRSRHSLVQLFLYPTTGRCYDTRWDVKQSLVVPIDNVWTIAKNSCIDLKGIYVTSNIGRWSTSLTVCTSDRSATWSTAYELGTSTLQNAYRIFESQTFLCTFCWSYNYNCRA